MTFAGEFLALPGLRGYWPMGAFDSSGNAIDQSGNARTLTYNGNPTFNYTTQGGSYIDLDGTGDYLTRADEAGVDILGTETFVNSAIRGLTLGGYFWFDDATTDQSVLSKYTDAGNQRSYLIYIASNALQMLISSNGTATTTINNATSISISTWYFVASRYTPSTELAIFVNEVKTTNTTSIPASIFNSTAAFQVGARNAGTVVMNGRASNCFLCAAVLSDTAISNLYNNTKAAYGL